ncbi:MAG: alpha/beta fold hydrolase [Bacteroidota bacterium]
MSHRFLYLVIAAIAASVLAAACAASAPQIIPTVTNPFDQKVDVGGHSMHIRCTGEGLPTVVVETGFGEPGAGGESSSWKNVVPVIEERTRVCVYDRAGLGSSDVAPGENRTSRDIARDLHTLLADAGVPGPYVLVGHSLGGFHVRVFASDYADEVAGIVLVDASSPDQWAAIEAVLPPASADEPASFRRIRLLPPASLPEKLDIPTNIRQVRAVKSFGSLPLVVLSHSPTWSVDPNLSPELSAKIEQVWDGLQDELAGLSSNSTHVIATHAGHYIQVDEPQLVIDAILKVIDEAKRQGR